MATATKILNQYQKAIANDYSLMVNANKGLSAQVFLDIVNISGFEKKFLAEMIFNMSVKTMVRYQKDNKKLNPRTSEIALKFINLIKKGEEIFGSITSFNSWLNKPAFGLGNALPISLLNTHTGMDLIEEELLRIEYGALA